MSLCLLFPGQGSQRDEMFADWPNRSPDIAARLEQVVGVPPARLTAGDLGRNAIAQPAIVAYQLAMVAALKPVLPDDLILLGYSVGELSACSAANMIEPGEAIGLAARRAAIMDRYGPPNSGMLAIRGLPLDRIREIASAFGVEIAIENGADHAVVGGAAASLDGAAPAFEAAGARTVRRLPVSVSSHVRPLAPAAPVFREALAASLNRDPEGTLIAGSTAHPLVTSTTRIAVQRPSSSARMLLRSAGR